jgi:hypothetical protein
MPHSRKVSHYPDEYADILRQAVASTGTTTMDFDTRLEAIKLRGHFYAYIGALRREERRIAASNEITSQDRDLLDLARLADKLLIQVVQKPGGTATLEFMARDRSWQAEKAREALRSGVKPLPPIQAVVGEDGFDKDGYYQGHLDWPRAAVEYCIKHGRPYGPGAMPVLPSEYRDDAKPPHPFLDRNR